MKDYLFKKGHIPWNKGKKMPEGTGEKIGNKLKGVKRSEEFKKKAKENSARYWLGKKRSKETIEKVRKARIGQKYPNRKKIPKIEQICPICQKKFYVTYFKGWANPSVLAENLPTLVVESVKCTSYRL
jgi:hypothetical protein